MKDYDDWKCVRQRDLEQKMSYPKHQEMSCMSSTGIETQTGFLRRKYRIEKVTSGRTMCTVHMRNVNIHPKMFFSSNDFMF